MAGGAAALVLGLIAVPLGRRARALSEPAARHGR
ncbi:hypothetical protein [Kitasatospora sp. NPDC097643]